MKREHIAAVLCLVSMAVIASLTVRHVVTPAMACLFTYLAWDNIADWLGGRWAHLRTRSPRAIYRDLRAGKLRLQGQALWMSRVALVFLGIGTAIVIDGI